jgi:putative FmdB family regulatory protein
MPNYGFECSDCGLTSEQFMSVTEYNKGDHKCAECGGDLTRTYNNPVPFHLKGGCWARDNYYKK